MARELDGGCLCGRIRYRCLGLPEWVTVCYCRFCQRATGSDRMVEPIFLRDRFHFLAGEPRTFDLPSEGSGKTIHVHFCPDCGTKLALTFERWPEYLGLYAGTLDDPSAVEVSPETGWQIFISEARPDSVIHGGVPSYLRHSEDNVGNPQPKTIPPAPMRANIFRATFLPDHPAPKGPAEP